MTERLHFHFSLSCIGEGNGNPLQCSCLENPRDRGDWWAAVYGVAQSRTQLKRLSSSSSSSSSKIKISDENYLCSVCVCVCVCVCAHERQLTLEQHRFELWQSTSTHKFFSTVSTSELLSLRIGWIPDGSVGLEETWMSGSDHKLYLDFPQSGGLAPLTPTLFKDQL